MPNELKPCPVCGGSLDYDVLGRPMQSVCRKCEERLLEEHKDDELGNCPFCGADREHLKHHIALPYFFGAEGVLVHCEQCGARSGWGAIREPLSICNLPMVNHKDENRENNEVNNLEWCTEKYNTNYGNARVKQAKAVSKAVVCIETGEVFSSQKEAGQINGVAHQHICDCCKGKKQTCGGYHWRYATKEESENTLKERVDNG